VPPGVAPGVSVVGTLINGINALGQLVGTYLVDNGTPNGTTHAFFENQGNFITLDPFNIRSQGGSINARAQVVGTYRTSEGNNVQKRHGFIWLNGTFTEFNVPDDDALFGTVAFGINDSGDVVGDYVANGEVPKGGAKSQNPPRHGFLRSSNGHFSRFDVPGAYLTIGEGINNAGAIVGVYVLSDGKLHGFVLNNGVVFTTVDVPDSKNGKAQQTEINSINANGEIVGYYIDSHGVHHGFFGVPAL
jgi:uncharacterized membrane protein